MTDFTQDIQKLLFGNEISLENKTYHLYPDKAFKKYYSPSNNDGSVKDIAFPIIGKEDMVIDGNGATLLCHGRITPFVIDGSENITIKNFVIDYTRPFYTQASVIASSAKEVTVSIDKKRFPHRVVNGHLIFFDENWEKDITGIPCLMQEFDRQTKAPKRHSMTMFGIFGEETEIPENMAALGAQVLVEVVSEDENQSILKFPITFMPGGYVFKEDSEIIICHEDRLNDIFFLNQSKNIILENIKIVTGGAMGVMAQLCENVTVRNFDVSLCEASKGLVTTLADATHFVNCSGEVVIENCRFENMMDDAANVHGIYTDIGEIISDNCLTVNISHYQQYGFNPYLAGDSIDIIDKTRLEKVTELQVLNADFCNREQSKIRITTAGPCSKMVREGMLVENSARMPSVKLYGNRCGNNRPRGFLLTTPKPTQVVNNHFYNSLFAIHISADANYWYESGAVRDIEIRGNLFEDCCYANDGPAILIAPEFETPQKDSIYFHKNIRIVGNTFKTFQNELLYAFSVDGITFKDNTYIKTERYENPRQGESVIFKQCKNVRQFE